MNIVIFFLLFILLSPKNISSWTRNEEKQLGNAALEASMELDLFIGKIYSFIFNNILYSTRTFTETKKIVIEFHQDRSFEVEKYHSEIGLYTENQFNILKIYHNDIGNYLKRKLEGLSLEWNVKIYSSYVYVEIIYYADLYDEIRRFSKKLVV
ncbi:hypothetical protein GLOIN_2v1607977 [Rhizophagus clarus]|uniref:Uncharacterized protein n=1 Tax=Rhizophagus clarus TaxID=94130 RepID=A0A8H3QMH1_9GLOM|nr:hypothetical protein GLOIN_2v1607977 [Rhizophagus clarus]